MSTMADTNNLKETAAKNSRGIARTVFVALLVDIFSFTIILPLFPRLLEYYRHHESQIPNSLFSTTLAYLQAFKHAIGATGSKLDVVLFGGIIGSLFSFLQFLASPLIGRLSDRFGRKRVLMLCMAGNLLSCFLWIVAKPFWVFVLSRVVGGLSEGNVQLSVAIMTDITTAETRSRALALVGIAFALGFTFGPAIGAYFASHDLAATRPVLESYGMNPYSASALFAFLLILFEIVFLQVSLPETLPSLQADSSQKERHSGSSRSSKRVMSAAQRNLRDLAWLHWAYLFVFSGLEFTLPFLTYDRFGYTNAQQGALLGYVGLVAAAVQGGYTRRVAHRIGERRIVVRGIASCAVAFAGCAIVAMTEAPIANMALWMAATLLAFTSATVVTCLTTLASHQCADSADSGAAMGGFRSWGQLGRAAGPVVACALYWLWGSASTYLLGSILLAGLSFSVARLPLGASGPDRPKLE